jgi:hypothetical protein
MKSRQNNLIKQQIIHKLLGISPRGSINPNSKGALSNSSTQNHLKKYEIVSFTNGHRQTSQAQYLSNEEEEGNVSMQAYFN